MHHLDDEAGKTQQQRRRPLNSNPSSNSNRGRSNSNAAQPTAMVGLISLTSSDVGKSSDKTDSLDLGYDSSSFISTTSITSSNNDQSLITSITSTGINDKNESLISSDLTSVDSGLDIQDTFSHLSIASQTSDSGSLQQSSSTSLPRNVQETVWLDAFYQDQDGDTHLHLAIIQGYGDAVFALIQLAPHPHYLDIQNDLSQSPLHLSVLTRQPHITRRLLLAGANPHTRDRCGNMPLHVACEQGDLDTVRQLTVPISFAELQTRTNQQHLQQQRHHRQHHLHRHHHQQQHQQLQQQHRNPVTGPAKTPSNLEARNYEGLRCVHIAAIKGHREVLRHLVAYGANVNAQEDRSGRTALHLAVETRNVQMVELLVNECGADVNAVTYSGHSAFQLACGSNSRMSDKLRQLGALPPLNNFSDSSESDSENMEHSDCDPLQMNGDTRW